MSESTYERQCNVCDHLQEVDPFDDFTCEQCGQKYERAAYAEGHRIVLSPEQCKLLRNGPPHCETCKWWTGEGGSPGRRCDHPKMNDDEDPDDDCAVALHGGIFSGPDFGCVHHEEKTG